MRPIGVPALLVILVLSSVPLASGQAREASKEFSLGDNEGDVKFRSGGLPVGLPLDWVDLKGLRIYDEDMEGVWVELTVKNLKRPPGLFFGSSATFSLRFKLEGTAYSYIVQWIPNEAGPDNETPSFRTNLCVRTRDDGGYGGGCYPRQRTFGGADYTKNRLWAYLPKLSLMGKDPVDARNNPDLGIQLPKGAKFSSIYAISSQGGFGLEDRLPDTLEGGPYELQQPSANDRIRIKLSPLAENQTREECPYYYCNPSGQGVDDYPKVSVEPGVTTLVRLDVVNLNGAKRIVNLSADLASKEDSRKWEVRIAPGVQIPGSDTRTVNLVVNATSATTHRESTLVRITGVSYLFRDEIGALTLRLVASVPPSLDQTTLYFHAAKYKAASTLSSCTVPFFGSWGCQPTRWLNTLETDATADLDAAGDERNRDYGFGFSQIRYAYKLDAALSRDVVLDVKQPFTALINIKSTFALEGTLEFRLSAGGKTVGSTRTSITLPQGGGATTLNFLPLVDGSRIKSGETLTADITIGYENLGAGVGSVAFPPFFVPKGSKLDLPITTDPNLTAARPIPIGDAFLGLTRLNKEDNEFAYPGRARVFEMTVVNEGGLQDVASITTSITSGDCQIEVRPGTSFRLDAGDSAKFGVLLRPSAEAKEGSQCHVDVNATSSVDEAVRITQHIYIVATRGIEGLPDDSETYLPDKDSEAKAAAVSPKARSPAAGLLGTLGALGVLAGRRRREE